MLYLVTGKLGSGKSLFAVSFAFRYLTEGRRVVANFPMDFSGKPQRKHPRAVVEVLPDLPTADDLDSLGRGGPSERESGVLIVDEGARWLNSRDWNDKGRARVLDWLLHSRKRGWDVVLIIQHHNMLDKQVREGLAEMHVICRRFDRVKLLGVRLPHIHQATTYYGIHLGGTNAPPKAESVMYSPKVWGVCYDTAAEFQESQARYSMLSRWHLVDRYKVHVGFRGWLLRFWAVYVYTVFAVCLLALGAGAGVAFEPFRLRKWCSGGSLAAGAKPS